MKILKTIIGIIIFGVLYLPSFALNIEITTDKEEVIIGENFNLNIDIEGDLTGENKLEEIKGLENFNIINKSQSQRSASRFVFINGEQKSESKSIYSIVYSLQANKKGNYGLGPIKITNSGATIYSNTINIKVSGKKDIGENKTELYTNTNKYNKNKENNIFKTINLVSKIIFFSLFFTLIIYYILKNKERIINLKYIKKIKSKINRYSKKSEDIEIYKETESKEIAYPKLNERNFVQKLEDIFKEKIKKKYKIKNIKNKTYVDILSELDNIKFYDLEKIKMLSNLFNKAKYSKISVDKKELLELVEKI